MLVFQGVHMDFEHKHVWYSMEIQIALEVFQF